MTIRGIEKYGKFNKQKKSFKQKIKRIFTGEKPDSEKEEEQDQTDARRVQDEEHDEGDSNHQREVDDDDEKVRRRRQEKDEPLPGEGKRVEDMTEEERLERGVALVQRAFQRGLNLEDRRDGGNDAGSRENGD